MITNGCSAYLRMLHSVIAYFKCLFLYRNAFLSTFIAYILPSFSLSEHLNTFPKAPCPSISMISKDLKPIPSKMPSSSSYGSAFLIFSMASGANSILFCISFMFARSFLKSALITPAYYFYSSFYTYGDLLSKSAVPTPPWFSLGGVSAWAETLFESDLVAGVWSVFELIVLSSPWLSPIL